MKSLASVEKKVIATATGLMFVFLGFLIYASQVLGIKLPGCNTDFKPFKRGQIIQRDPSTFEVQLVAKMWAFDPAEILIPIGATAQIYLTSQDVGHGFYVQGTNINLMAIPGAVNAAMFKAETVGDYRILCHEYCGVGHQNMAAVLRVFDPNSNPVLFTKAKTTWRSSPIEGDSADPTNVSSTGISLTDLQAKGKTAFQEKTCIACHSVDGSPMVGPTLKGLLGRVEKFEDGSEKKIDEQYIRDYIRHPNVHVVKGFAPVMPTLQISDSEIESIIEFIKTLK